MEPNRAIELHDSDVTAVSWVGRELHLAIDAYVHASNGAPAIDAGSGWIWPGVLVVDAAEVLEGAPGAFTILDGTVTIDRRASEGLVRLPFDVTGRVRLDLHGADARLVVEGTAARFVAAREPRWVELFQR